MATLCICHDSSNAPRLRKTQKAAHFLYIESIMDKLLVAGPLCAQAPDTGPEETLWEGSLFVYATDDRQTALNLLHNDPYYQSGVYDRIECQYFLPAAGAWPGGASWKDTTESKE